MILAAIFIAIALAITVYLHGVKVKQRREFTHHTGKTRIGL